MALFFSCLMVGLVVIAVWKRNYKKETIDNILSEGNKKEWLRFLFPMGLWIYDLLSKKQPAQNEEEREWAKALYVREDAKKKLQLQGARQMVNLFIFCECSWNCCFIFSRYASTKNGARASGVWTDKRLQFDSGRFRRGRSDHSRKCRWKRTRDTRYDGCV